MTPTETRRIAEEGRAAIPLEVDACFALLTRVEEQLRFADSKAAFIATLHAFLIGPLAGNVVGIRPVIAAWNPAAYHVLALAVAAYAIMFVATMGIVAAAVLPRVSRTSGRVSKVYFGRIAREFASAPEQFAAELGRMTEEEWVEELGIYLVGASTIASRKHRLVVRATQATVPTVILWLLMVVVLAVAGQK